ncbi:MAG: FAD-dependent monooxygenase [Planctomycetota bacterium]
MGTRTVVIGAGVAGTLAARMLVRAGHAVTIVERERFPRDKICGACLSPVAMRALREAGLETLPGDFGSAELTMLELHAGGRHAELPVAGGVVLSRATLDHALLAATGAELITGVTAREQGEGRVELSDGRVLAADLVLRATGLGGGKIAPRSLLGTGAVFDAGDFPRGRIIMAHAPAGYVGAAVGERDRLIVGAALRPADAQRDGIGATVQRILAEAGRPPLPDHERWRGTPLLTRAVPKPFHGRTLLIGDAAGYVEPFTGEGMGWAMQSALAAARVAADGWREGLGEAWAAERDRILHTSQRRCRILTRAMRIPGAVPSAVRALRLFPSVASPLVRRTTAWASNS